MATAALAPQIASAQGAFAFDSLPTQVVGITPPTGWRTAYFSVQGAVAELGELTTRDADVSQWRDIIAYLTTAKITGTNVTDMDANLAEVSGHCSAHAIFRHRPSMAREGENWAEIVCFERVGETLSLAGAPLQIYVFRSLQTEDASFRFWRAWRGRPQDVAGLLSAMGVADGPALRAQPSARDLQGLGPAMSQLTEAWGRELTQALEVCDLAATPCASLNRSTNFVPAYELLTARAPLDHTAALLAIRGDRSDPGMANTMYRQMFGSPPPGNAGEIAIATLIQPRNHDFRAMRSLGNLAGHLFIASKANGGIISVAADAPLQTAAEAARYRAYLLRVARMASAAPNGPPADAYTFDLWPNE